MNEPIPPGEDFAATLLGSYRDSAYTSYPPPPAASVAARARQRTRRRTAVAAAGLVLALGGATFFGIQGRNAPTGGGDGDTGTPSASSSPSERPQPAPTTAPPSPATTSPGGSAFDITKVNWRSATITLPANRDGLKCPTGRVTTRGTETIVGGVAFAVLSDATFGDLTGDSQPEAVIHIACYRPPSADDPGDVDARNNQLLVVTQQNGELRGLGYAGPPGERYLSWTAAARTLVITLRARFGPDDGPVQERTFAWNGSRFVQTGGPTAAPPR